MIQFPQSMIVRSVRWTEFKSLCVKKTIPTSLIQFEDEVDYYTVWAFDDNNNILRTEIWKNVSTDLAPDYTQSQATSDQTDFETNYKSLCNGALTIRTPDGRHRVASEKTNSSTITFYSFDWTDPCTWYINSVLVLNEILTNPSGDGYAFKTAHLNIIDSYHGLITGEDYLKDAAGNSFRVLVKVDGYARTEQDPHFGTGGHYTVSYRDGYVHFLNPVDPTSVVTATYHYATNANFTIAPAAGKQIRLATVEVQFSDDVIINDSVLFQPFGFVEAFAPQYCTTNGGPYPPGTKIPLGSPLVYKSISDYLNDSKKSYPTYPALGGPGWRGMTRPSIIMDWEYEGEKVLRSDQGMEIRVSLQHNSAFGGTFATATFYCRSENLT